MSRFLLHDNDTAPLHAIGGKAAGLRRLQSLGLRVPHFVILSADAYRIACADGAVPDSLPPDIARAVHTAWEELGGGTVPLAVRSSAVEEDGMTRSFAGQMETALNVQTLDALMTAVLGCWRSLHSQRACAYRSWAGTQEAPAMSVVIQAMIVPEVSGVAFTMNPVSGRRDEILVNAIWGLGEGLVSGALDADTFVLDREGRVTSRHLASKETQIVCANGGGTTAQPVEAPRAGIPTLDTQHLSEITQACLAVESACGGPQDIEFSIQDGALIFLQSRPITNAVAASVSMSAERFVWDNSNINESYPDFTLPLTYSFIRHAYHAVYRQFCELIGLSREDIDKRDPMLWNMLGLIRGRVYYNLLNWYRLVSLLPGFRFNKTFMENMMGLQEPEGFATRPACWKRRYFVEFPLLVRTGFRAWWLHCTLAYRVRRFHQDFARVHRDWASVDFSRLTRSELWEAYRDLETRVLWRWKAPIVNDFEAMIFYGLLKRITVAWGIDPHGSIQNLLLSEQGDMESTQVSEQLVDLARHIAAEPELAASFARVPPPEAARMLKEHPRLGQQLSNYLNRYGDRAVEELKLESTTMNDDPAFCAAMMQNYLRTATHQHYNGNERDLTSKARAHQRVMKQLSASGFCGLGRRFIYRWILERARQALRSRENQRLERTRAFGLLRRIFRSIGGDLARCGAIANREDIFYLTIEEVAEIIEQDDGSENELRELIARRKAEYDSFRSAPPLPNHFETFGHPQLGSYEILSPRKETNAAAELKGLGACPGVVESRAVVLEKPSSSTKLDGEILVTRQTDPGWVVLFPSIRGLIVERGSMLSHSAIVAREMGIPTVVGVVGATTAIRTGDVVRLDGHQGTVEIISAAGE